MNNRPRQTDKRINFLRRDGLRVWRIMKITGLPAHRVIAALDRGGWPQRTLIAEWRRGRK